MIRTEILTRGEDLISLEPAWLDLWRRSARATPFQSPAWLLPSWRAYGNSRLYTVAWWHGRELMGLAPFYIYGEGPMRRLFSLGISSSDYLDILAAPEFEPEIGERLAELTSSSKWDVCDFQELRPGSLLLEA